MTIFNKCISLSIAKLPTINMYSFMFNSLTLLSRSKVDMLGMSLFLLWTIVCTSRYDTYQYVPYAPNFISMTTFFIS